MNIHNGLSTLGSSQEFPFFEEGWPLSVPCSYWNHLTYYMYWYYVPSVAHGLMIEYSGKGTGYSGELYRDFYENGPDLTLVRCVGRHPGRTAVHLSPSGRVVNYHASNPKDAWIWPEWYRMDMK